MGGADPFSLDAFYDAYPRVEADIERALDASLHPRGPDLLYELVADLALPPRARAVDVGCGEGRHALRLAQRSAFDVLGIDPLARHIEIARAALAAAAKATPELAERVRFEPGSAEELPVPDRSIDLVWCRDVLSHVADLERAYAEIRRVLRDGGRALVYQMFATERLEPREREWLWRTMGGASGSADPARTEAAIATAGLRIDARIDLESEWGEWREERDGDVGRRLLHAARLLRAPDRYVAEFGRSAYEIALGDRLWHVYRMIGKLSPRVYQLSATG